MLLAEYELGKLLLTETYSDYNPEEGIEWLRRSAKQGFVPAQSALGILYYNGLGNFIKPNVQEARCWFDKAAKQDDGVAQYYLGEIYFEGNGVRKNRKEGFKWYKKSSKSEYVSAQQKLAYCYLNGIGTPKNDDEGYLLLASLALWGDEEALTLLQSAAVLENAAAEFGMWVFHYNQDDIETGYQWLEKAAEKEHGNALYAMAVRYDNEGNDPQKLRYFRRAAGKGHADAQHQLGLLLENCANKKAPKNEKAFMWMNTSGLDKDRKHHFILPQRRVLYCWATRKGRGEGKKI